MIDINYNFVLEKLKKFNSNKNLLDKNIFINWFFIPKLHPFYMKKYENLKKNYFYLILHLIKNFFKIIAVSFINIFKKNYTYKDFDIKEFDYVIISHHISNNKIFSEDVYFKNILSALEKKNKKYLIVYLNHNIDLKKKMLKNKKNYYFLSRNLSIKNEICSLIKIINLLLFYLMNNSFKFKDKITILSEVLSLETLDNIKISMQIKKIFDKIDFKYLICTFEGFNFEKIIYNLVKKKNPNIQNIGYQHSPILEKQKSLFEFQKTNFYPDIILTSGNYYKKMFKRELSLNSLIFNYGSNKFTTDKISTYHKKNFCLVLPEAILSECELLFKFSIEYIKKYENLNFIWRLHPLMNFESTLRKLNIQKKNLNNIYLSTNTDDDFIKSKYCLYRGSSSIIQGLNHLNHPIYLDLNSNLNINFLHDLELVDSIKTIDELKSISSLGGKKIDKSEIKKTIIKYFSAPNCEFIDLI